MRFGGREEEVLLHARVPLQLVEGQVAVPEADPGEARGVVEPRAAHGERAFAGGARGGVDALHEDAGHRAVATRDGLVDEIDVALFERRAGCGAVDELRTPGRVRLAGAIHLVEQCHVTLGDGFGQRLGHGAAHDGPVADEREVAGVGHLEQVVGPAQHREERRRLVEELEEVVALGGELAFAQHLRRGLRAGDQHATDAVREGGFIDRAVAVGPVDFLQLAETDDGHADIFMPHRAFAAHHLFDLPTDHGPDFFPGAARGRAEDGGMFLRSERAGKRIVVEADEIGAPHDHRGMPRGQQDAHGGAQRLRPRLRVAQGCLRPRMGTDELTHGAPAREEFQADFG
jgi:hypothetical protein